MQSPNTVKLSWNSSRNLEKKKFSLLVISGELFILRDVD